MIDGRTISLVIIGLASIFVVFMIVQTFKNNLRGINDDAHYQNFDLESSYEYQYDTLSYDFRPYQSQDIDNGSEARGFRYNQTIRGQTSSFSDKNMEVEQNEMTELDEADFPDLNSSQSK